MLGNCCYVRRRDFEALDCFGGTGAALAVGGDIVVERGTFGLGHRFEGRSDDGVDVGKGYASLTESEIGHFVGGVDGAGCRAAFVERAFGEAETGEPQIIGLDEVEAREVGDGQAPRAVGQTGRVAESVCDGEMHVGGAELGLDRTVVELYHGVDYRLRMYHGHDTVDAYVEEPASLDYLESLVDHRSRIDGNLGAHDPVGVMQGVGGRDAAQLAGCEIAERATRCGDDEAAHLVVALAAEALVDGRVFRVDRYDARAGGIEALRHERTGGDESLLVGECYILFGLDGAEGRHQSGVAYGGCDNLVDVVARHRVGYCLGSGGSLYAERSEGVAKLAIAAFVGYDGKGRTQLPALPYEQIDV